jgi:Carboxypeptidase regulatory-like domain
VDSKAILRALSAAVFCAAATLLLPAQDPAQGQAPMQAPQSPAVDRTLATLHGVVRNSATGEGVPRALVEIEGDASTGALTDGDGRFEIPNVAVGPQAVAIRRPGFLDESNQAETPSGASTAGIPHNVLVASDMPDVVFTLTPACAIRGHIELSNGDSAAGIEVGLVRRIVMDGRAIWQPSGFTKTRSDGSYRFGGLTDGEYELYTTPVLDSEPAATLVTPGKAAATARWGYASVFYPDARDPSGAAQIAVANGQEAQANLTLTREPFQTVTANVILPQNVAVKGETYSVEVLDAGGHQLLYPAQFDQSTQTAQAVLPDGSYSLLVTGALMPSPGREGAAGAEPLVGLVDFAVAGRAIMNLHLLLSAPSPSSVQVSVIHSGTATVQMQNQQVAVMVSPASGPLGGAVMGQYATGTVDAPLPASYMAPGAYWVHTYLAGSGLCESSFTAGGANLGREPVTIGISGATAPLELALRDDCAQLTLQLPENLAGTSSGEEKFYTAYVVPDFDFTRDLDPALLRPSSRTFTVHGLTPGNYHVYTFEGNTRLEYRNSAVLAALPNPGQAITLSPGTASDLVLETSVQ